MKKTQKIANTFYYGALFLLLTIGFINNSNAQHWRSEGVQEISLEWMRSDVKFWKKMCENDNTGGITCVGSETVDRDDTTGCKEKTTMEALNLVCPNGTKKQTKLIYKATYKTQVNGKWICRTITVTFLFNYNTTCMSQSVGEKKAIELKENVISPNPVRQGNDITIRFEQETILSSVQLMDLSGRVVYENRTIDKNEVSIATDELNTGMYLIRSTTSNGQSILNKVIVE